jgi:hypothetical protein
LGFYLNPLFCDEVKKVFRELKNIAKVILDLTLLRPQKS